MTGDLSAIRDSREKEITLKIYNSARKVFDPRCKAINMALAIGLIVLVFFGMVLFSHYPSGTFWHSNNGPAILASIAFVFSIIIVFATFNLFWSLKYKNLQDKAVVELVQIIVAYGNEAKRPMEFFKVADSYLYERVTRIIYRIGFKI